MFLGGVMLGFSVIVRPISFYLPVILVPFIVIMARSNYREGALLGLVFLTAFSMFPGAWMVRNYQWTGIPRLSKKQGDNLLHYRAAGAVAEARDISFNEGRKVVLQRYKNKLDGGMSIAEKSQLKSSIGLDFILKYPVGYTISATKGMIRIILGPGRGSMLELLGFEKPTKIGSPARLAIVSIQTFVLFLIYVMCFFGLIEIYRNSYWKPFLLIGSVTLYFLVVSSGPEAYSRFRVPLMPLVSLIAGIGISSFKKYLPRALLTQGV